MLLLVRRRVWATMTRTLLVLLVLHMKTVQFISGQVTPPSHSPGEAWRLEQLCRSLDRLWTGQGASTRSPCSTSRGVLRTLVTASVGSDVPVLGSTHALHHHHHHQYHHHHHQDGQFLTFNVPASNRSKSVEFRRSRRFSLRYHRGQRFSDSRALVHTDLIRKYPFSNIVRLSTGCTGSLLTPAHVLTAAHCVHNGEGFKNKLEMLKIEVPDTMGFRLHYIEKLTVPTPWKRSKGMADVHRASFDYAVVQLSMPVPRRSQFMPLAVPTASTLGQDLYYLGFFLSSQGSDLWKSRCRARYALSLMDGNLILTRCDATIGNSGAAVFAEDPRDGMRIVGVLSHSMSVATASMSHSERYSIVTALTWRKLYEICSMLAPYGTDYGVCPPMETIGVRADRIPLSNRVIPFFG